MYAFVMETAEKLCLHDLNVELYSFKYYRFRVEDFKNAV